MEWIDHMLYSRSEDGTWETTVLNHICDGRGAVPDGLRRVKSTNGKRKTRGTREKNPNSTAGRNWRMSSNVNQVSVLHSLQTYKYAAMVGFVSAAAYFAVRDGNAIHIHMGHVLTIRHGSAKKKYKFRLYIYILLFCVYRIGSPHGPIGCTWCNTRSGCRAWSPSPHHRAPTGCLTPGSHGCQRCRLLDSAGTASPEQNLRNEKNRNEMKWNSSQVK